MSSPVIDGVGKDEPTVTNAAGGKQSRSPFRCDLLPPHAVLAVAKVLKDGADKYGANNWHAITVAENLNHAMTHVLAFAAGDGQDDHLEHAACRLLFALDQRLSGREKCLQDNLGQPKQAASSKPPAIRVYIACPITKGDLAANINRASQAFRSLQQLGFAPLCPAWSCFASGVVGFLPSVPGRCGPQAFAIAEPGAAGLTHAEWLDVDLPWVRSSHAVLRLPGESVGAEMEVSAATEAGIPVFFDVATLLAWRGEMRSGATGNIAA